ncbi:MAG: anti-sigma factor [Dehalococcoidia bacterium]
MNYGCSDAAEALAAYALDALPVDERLNLVEHLAECREHDEELAGYRMVTTRLALTVDVPAAPGTLKSSLLDAFDRERTPAISPIAAVRAPAAPVGAVPVAAVVESPAPVRSGGFFAIFRQPALAYGIAAALLIAVVSLGAWNMSLQDNGEDVMTTAAAGPGMSLNVTYYGDRQVVVFDLDMPPTSAGQVYQAWMIADGKPVSLGVLASNSGRQAFAADMHTANAVAISVEPAGGSAAPTTNPIVVAEF